MEMTGEYRIAAPREEVWHALNDPAVLQACIPGCESLEKTTDNELKANVRIKIGPVSARFSGKVTLSDLDPPNGYRITGEGSGGAAGFAKGGATVNLTSDGPNTVLQYKAEAQVGGKLAQVGSRLIDGTARKLADEFFGAFAAKVQAASSAAGTAPQPEAAAPAASSQPAVAPAPQRRGATSWIIAGVVVAVVVVAYLLLR